MTAPAAPEMPPADHEFTAGPGQPLRCLLCGGRTEEYCGPVVHHADCKHYRAPDPNARILQQKDIDRLLGFNNRPAPAPQAEPFDSDANFQRAMDTMPESAAGFVRMVKAEQPDVDALIAELENAHSYYQHAPDAELKSAQAEYHGARENLRAAFAATYDPDGLGDRLVHHGTLYVRAEYADGKAAEKAAHITAERDAAVAERNKLMDDLSYANLTMTGIEDRAKAAEAREAALLAALKPIVAEAERDAAVAALEDIATDKREHADDDDALVIRCQQRAETTLANLPALARGDMVMVPREPTRKMIDAWFSTSCPNERDDWYAKYAAMIAVEQEKPHGA